MTRDEFKTAATKMAARNNWTLDVTEEGATICAWFSEPHPKDAPGRPYGADTAQAYMKDGDAPVGLED